MHILKPFDLVVAIKIGLNERAARFPGDSPGAKLPTNSVGDLAESLFKAKGDVSRAINRLVRLQLIGKRRPKAHDAPATNRKHYSVNRRALAELLCFGIRHIFTPDKTGFGRGVATGWNCPLIQSPMVPPEIPLVWSLPGGKAQGELLEPLYPKCPQAAQQDQGLYRALSLVEVVRTGKPRELKYAKDLLHETVMELHA